MPMAYQAYRSCCYNKQACFEIKLRRNSYGAHCSYITIHLPRRDYTKPNSFPVGVPVPTGSRHFPRRARFWVGVELRLGRS